MLSKKTKIVATIGPKTESVLMMEKMVKNGMNVVRLNMSHGNHEEHLERIKNAKIVSEKLKTPVAVLVDLSGPKIRTGEYVTEKINLKPGKIITLTTEKIIGDESRISINYKKLPQEVERGSVIMLDDGKKKLIVEKVSGADIVCRIVIGGEMKPKRGVNIPGAYLSIKSITEKDKKDLEFAVSNGADMVALSFVRTASDIQELRSLLKKAGKEYMPIISKIETQESIDNLDEIMTATDGVMVARGDLAIEVPAEMVPIYQKEIIARANALAKPVITATQMLESMIHSPVPTRAEVSDIANAVYDGTDAVMLSEESTLGEYPLEAVSMMSKIAVAIETELASGENEYNRSVSSSVNDAVIKTASDVGAALIVSLTESGRSAEEVARSKPNCPIIALTPRNETVKRLALTSGVHPFKTENISTLDDALKSLSSFLKSKKLVKKGDLVVMTAGLSFGITGSTNLLCVIEIK